MKDNIYQIKPTSVMVFWVLMSMFIYPAVIFAVGAVSLPFAVFLNNVEGNFIAGIIALFVVPIWGVVAGSVIGRFQRYVLREKLYWAADGWVKWTMIGSGVGVSVAFLASQFTDPLFSPTYDGIWLGYPFVLYLTILSAVQLVALRHAVDKSWWWVVANSISSIVMIGVIANNIPDSNTIGAYSINIIAIPVVAAIAQATITGFILLHLFEKHLHDMEPENADDLPDEKPTSVWDKAI